MDEATHLDRRIADLADRQHGVVSHTQLVALGLTAAGIEARRRRGALHPCRRGVYAIGCRALPLDGRRMAVTLACGDGAVLSDRSAGALHAIRAEAGSRWHVTIPTRSGRAHPGVVIHRPRYWWPDESTSVRGIPVTTVARTLLDLAATLSDAQLTAACDEAERQRQIDWTDALVLLDRHRRHRGRRRLQRVLALAGIETRQSKSLVEDAFVAICVAHALPAPAQNVDILGHWVDAVWEDRRLVVEVDHDEWHHTRFAREADKRRDLELTLAGYRVVRVTEGRIKHDADAVGAQIRALYHAPLRELGRLAVLTAR